MPEVYRRPGPERSSAPAEWAWALLPGVSVAAIETVRKWLAPDLFSAGQSQPLRRGR